MKAISAGRGRLGLAGVSLLGLSLVAWLAALRMTETSMLDLPGFLLAWAAMMAAIMAPALLPTFLLFETIARSRTKPVLVAASQAAFVLGYFGVWVLSGWLAFAIAQTVEVGSQANLGIGVGLLVAGVYQLSSFKNRCLVLCRTPMDFFMQHWRDDLAGSVWMGVKHGAYCLGCCWGVMVALLVLGMMNPLWMLAAAALIVLEKHLPTGERVAKITGIAFVLAGAYILLGGPIAIGMGGM
jgi:predicted metal-binding membrane protein